MRCGPCHHHPRQHASLRHKIYLHTNNLALPGVVKAKLRAVRRMISRAFDYAAKASVHDEVCVMPYRPSAWLAVIADHRFDRTRDRE